MFPCLQQSLAGLNYSTPVRAWLEAFPANQVHLLQYEALTRPERAEARLAGLKRCVTGWFAQLPGCLPPLPTTATAIGLL